MPRKRQRFSLFLGLINAIKNCMKKFLLIILLSFLTSVSFANHTKGGWLYYEYLGPGTAANTSQYRVTLKLYTECNLTPGQIDAFVPFTFFNASTNAQVYNISVPVLSDINTSNCATTQCHPCIADIPLICYKIRTYQLEIELPNTAAGYIVAYQRCCRVINIENIQAPSNNFGETWTVQIPGTVIPNAEKNSSAKFSQNDTAIICKNSSFTFDFSATDINNDSLVYSFVSAYTGGGQTNANPPTCLTCPSPDPSANPPFALVSYSSGYSGLKPLGSLASINSQTGLVSGIAPGIGEYVVTVLVSEYRRGTNIKIAEVRKSLHIEVANCSITKAELEPEYKICDAATGFTVTFSNGNNNNIQTYDWSFGDGNTSTLSTPTHTYADTGVYLLKLVVNRSLPCSDSTTAPVKVYPGFFPDFIINGQCQNVPVQFLDNTIATYGTPNKWNWNFGDPTSPINTSILQNPTHIFRTTGSYDITLISFSDKGCNDTIVKRLDILDQPPLSLQPKDTLICSIDTLQLNAVGTGSFLWTPNYMISNVNIPNPLVSPDVTTTYRVQLTDAFGCQGSDTVRVRVVNNVTQFAGPDTSICKTDPVLLQLTSDALHYVWTENPAGNTLNNPFIKNPTARPLVTTTYHVLGNIGKCIAENDIKITPVPYPVANAGPDSTICFGKSVQLNASGGSIYNWSPAAFLTATNIYNPVSVSPTANVRYIVTVRDVRGCPKPVKDTVFVFVAKIKADAGPRDTSVVLDQPLQLFATGSINYAWSPVTWLNNPNIHNPIALPRNDIEYVVTVSNNAGCFDRDSIRVHVFFIKPDLLVPNAFTPNGNGTNDIFKPIPIGLKSVDIFRVYNRWGQMLYSGSGNDAGWDGTFAGKKQEMATYVWYAEGTDYLNNKLRRKGSVILIR
jgi:gliding motility-associated-like protein